MYTNVLREYFAHYRTRYKFRL